MLFRLPTRNELESLQAVAMKKITSQINEVLKRVQHELTVAGTALEFHQIPF
jgi:hypothetical protein